MSYPKFDYVLSYPKFDYVAELGMTVMKEHFREYYRVHKPHIPDVEHRELAYVPFATGEKMIRHCIWVDVINRLTKIVPRHLYNSVAYYERPYIEDMKEKGLINAPLVFDIDCDHIPQAKGKEYSVMLEFAKDNAERLIDCITDELGVENKYIEVYFSGNRGYHVYVTAPEVIKLGRLERRTIIDYVKLNGYEPRRDRDITHRKLTRGIIYIDEAVTADMHRLIRSVGSLHGKTGMAVVKVNNLDSFKPLTDAVVLSEDEVKLKCVQDAEFVLKDNTFNIKKGKKYALPAYAAVYALGHKWVIP